MSLTGYKLYGATVKNFSTQLGFGTQPSSITIDLVEDLNGGDFFLAPPIGSPTGMSFGSLSFYGILQRWIKSLDASGFPVYQINIEAPVEILEGASLIMSSYNDSTLGVPNLYNVYGYLENSFGFGGSLLNPGGIPWSLVSQALLAMINGSGTAYGSPLIFKGGLYRLDLSELPAMPSFYRVGGSPNMGLLDLISQVCSDGGMDYFVDMTPTGVIRVRTVNRRFNAPLGTISAYVQAATLSGICKKSTIGLEARKDTTSAIICGGEKQYLWQIGAGDTVPYFGRDSQGKPIVGVQSNPGDPYSLTANLNAVEVSDIIGSDSYTCDALEMCIAMSDSIDSWMTYLYFVKPDLAQILGVGSIFAPAALNQVLNGKAPQKAVDLINFKDADLKGRVNALLVETLSFYKDRLYAFVRKTAEQYLGKAFLAKIPFTLSYVESETAQVVYSNVPTDGGYSDSGLPPLGLNPLLAEKYRTSDGRFQGMALYTNLAGLDLSSINSSSVMVDTLGIYTSISLGEIVRVSSTDICVEVFINSPVYSKPTDGTGAGLEILAAVLQQDEERCKKILANKLGGGSAFTKIPTIAKQPDLLSIPLLSKIETYGPWVAIGSPGKTEFEFDSTLVPWNYGTVAAMNQAANAKIEQKLTLMQEVETGSFDLVGVPLFSLGDTISAGSPNLTGISVSVGADGVTTSYKFSQFTPKFGSLSKANIDRFKRINQAMNETKKNAAKNTLGNIEKRQSSSTDTSKYLASKASNLGIGEKGQSPHYVLISKTIVDEYTDPVYARASGTYKRNDIATMDLREATSLMGVSGGENLNTAYASFDTIFRPFQFVGNNLGISGFPSVSGTGGGPGYLPVYRTSGATYLSNNCNTYNPYVNGNDFEIYSRGTGTGILDPRAYISGGPPADIRSFALRGPLLVCGWGYNTDGFPVPNENIMQTGATFLSGTLRRSDQWMVGPVDLLWDKYRNVWTPHGMCIGTASGDIGTTGIIVLHNGTVDTRYGVAARTVYNITNLSITSGTTCIAAWIPDKNRWYITTIACD